MIAVARAGAGGDGWFDWVDIPCGCGRLRRYESRGATSPRDARAARWCARPRPRRPLPRARGSPLTRTETRTASTPPSSPDPRTPRAGARCPGSAEAAPTDPTARRPEAPRAHRHRPRASQARAAPGRTVAAQAGTTSDCPSALSADALDETMEPRAAPAGAPRPKVREQRSTVDGPAGYSMGMPPPDGLQYAVMSSLPRAAPPVDPLRMHSASPSQSRDDRQATLSDSTQ